MSISISKAKQIGNKVLSKGVNGESARAESMRIIAKHTALGSAIELNIVVKEYKLKRKKKQIRESINNLLRDTAKTKVKRAVQTVNNKQILFYYIEQTVKAVSK